MRPDSKTLRANFCIIDQSFEWKHSADLQQPKLSRQFAKHLFFSTKKYWALFSLLLAFVGFYAGAALGKNTHLQAVKDANLYASAIFSLCFLAVATAGGLFDRSIRLDFSRAIKRVFSATIISAVLVPALLLFGLFLPLGRYSTVYGTLVAFFAITLGFFILSRFYKVNDLTIFFLGKDSGVSREIKEFVRTSLKKNIVHINDFFGEQTPMSLDEAMLLLTSYGSGDVIITGARDTPSAISFLAVRAIQCGFRVLDETTFFAELFNRYPIENLSLDRLVAEGFALPNPITRAVKRVFDIVGAIFLLIVATPLFLIAPILIKLESSGPVFFHQRRQGQFGTHFWMHKFRTMHWQGPTVDDVAQAKHDDPRITRIGKTLRKLHLDEFPQLVNVLLGEMSFVGPRPEISDVGGRISEFLPAFEIRQMCRPGLTGLANITQGKTLFSKDEMTKKLSYDLYYIKHYSLSLDLWILFRTIGSLMRGTW